MDRYGWQAFAGAGLQIWNQLQVTSWATVQKH